MKIAIKILTQSDRSFFKVHLKLSKQKAINLNRDVFIDRFYPGLRGIFLTVGLPLSIIGPGARPAHRLMRKVLLTEGGKNWRLNGEFVHDPVDDPGRYDHLQDGDFAVMAFDGHERPENLTLVLVSAVDDAELHRAIADAIPFNYSARDSMREISETFIGQLRARTKDAYPHAHPLDAIMAQDTIEDVLFSQEVTTTTGPTSGLWSPMTPEELRRQLLGAGETGQRGEALFASWLTTTGHGDDDFDWVALTYARSAFDFDVRSARWIDGTPRVVVDVKASRGAFDSPIHMSIAQVRFAAATPTYRIARVYQLDGDSPKLKLLKAIDVVAASTLKVLGNLPSNVTADSIQMAPKLFEVELSADLPSYDD